MDLFAAEIGMDPAEVRRMNLVAAVHRAATQTRAGALYDSGDYAGRAGHGARGGRLRRAARRAGAPAGSAGDVRQLGIGLSVYVEITGAGSEAGGPNENATVEVHPDGSATILTGTSPHGQGHATAWAMLASEQLGIPLERITVLHWGDTDLVPEGRRHRRLAQPAAGRCGGPPGGRRAARAGAGTRRGAARGRPRGPGRRPRGGPGWPCAGVPGASVSFAELAETEPLLVQTTFSQPGSTYPFGAHVAVVEVDVESGKAEVLRLIAVDDAGTILNPLLAEGQRHGGLAQGIAQALLEEVLYDDDGNPTTSTLADYPFVSATELPSFELVDMETPTRYNPLGAKGIGEAGTIGATPAVQNAVDRRRRPPRRPAHRHAHHPHAGVAGDPAGAERRRRGRLMQVSMTVNGEAAHRRGRAPAAAGPLPARGRAGCGPPTSAATPPPAGRAPSSSTG